MELASSGGGIGGPGRAQCSSCSQSKKKIDEDDILDFRKEIKYISISFFHVERTVELRNVEMIKSTIV